MILSLTRLTNLANKPFSKTLLLVAVGVCSWTILPISSSAIAATLTPTSSPETSAKTGFEHESTDLIADVLYLRPSSTYRDMANSGAHRVNRDYALGQSDIWYIEEQRFGADAIISGLLHNDLAAIEAGFKMFDWGFAQQQPDGSFGNTGDAFHSTSLFVQSVAYALLTLQESPTGAQYTDVFNEYLPKLNNAARWMIQDEVLNQGLTHTEPYTHRYYIISAALGLTGKLTNDQQLIDHANETIVSGLDQQRDDGVNPELGGHDSSYQMAGALYAMRWLTHFSNDPLAVDVASMLDRALLWEDSIILETGAIGDEGNTRTPDKALSRTGQFKNINHREVVHGFAYWFSITDESLWESNAIQVAQYYYANDQRVIDNLNQIESNRAAQSVPDSSYPVGLLISGIVGAVWVRKPLRF